MNGKLLNGMTKNVVPWSQERESEQLLLSWNCYYIVSLEFFFFLIKQLGCETQSSEIFNSLLECP